MLVCAPVSRMNVHFGWINLTRSFIRSPPRHRFLARLVADFDRFHSDDAVLWDPQRINYTSGRDGVATSSKISVSSYITDNNTSREYLLIHWICVFVCSQLASEDAGNVDVH